LIQDLLHYSKNISSTYQQENQQLQRLLQESQLDLADSVKSRRDLQQQLQHLESQKYSLSQANERLKNSSPYVVVLIDGDGLLFKESFIRQGMEGGKKAAYALRSAILSQCGDHASDVEVIAKVYANLSGLCKAMRRDGSIESESDLKDFTLGFTQGKATFDFIDVGHGKERADNKLKETTKWNLKNHNCKQVILGISHDSGYAPFLDELFQDDSTQRRITIIEGFPTTRELVATGVHILNLNDTIFRSEKLIDKLMLNSLPSPAITTGTPRSVSATSGSTPAPTSATSAASTPAPAPAPATTWASTVGSVGNASPPAKITLPIQPRSANTLRGSVSQPKSAPVTWNPGERGLDPPIQVSQTALDNIKKRKDSNKLCNNHYLRGPCAKGDACCFEHKYKPTKDEVNAIAFLARLNPCTSGQGCDVEDCIYGHHCPSVRDGVCTHPYCKFDPEDHPPGTKFRSKSHDY